MANGFVIVATVHKMFYQSALLLSETILDHYPSAKISLFTEKRFISKGDSDIFDNVVTDVPVNERTKLWALSQSPYTKTCYVDADCECLHGDVSKIFTQLGKNDIALTKIREYASAIDGVWFNNGNDRLTWHCGVLVYKHEMKPFMLKWYETYLLAKNQPERFEDQPHHIKQWDQYAFWYLLKHNPEISIKELDARWNFINTYYEDETDKPIVFYHHTLDYEKSHQATARRPEKY